MSTGELSTLEVVHRLRTYEEALSAEERALVHAVYLQLRRGAEPHGSDVDVLRKVWGDLARDLGAGGGS